MPERVTVACPAGHPITTAVRGRSTSCPRPGCRRRVFVRADGTTRHGKPKAAAAASPAASRPPGRADQAEPEQPGGHREAQAPQQPAEPFRWGRRRWDEAPHEADTAEYDAQADRTKLFDAEGRYLGWMDGDPYELADEMGTRSA